jgi:regulator of protease activity HflC (stomatin/prohibitin superfamily)
MIEWFVFAILALGGSVLASSVKIVNEKNEFLVERLGSFNKKLTPGLNFIFPLVDRVVFQETTREKVIDIPPQSCITKDNVSITVDAVVYWRIVNMQSAYYKVENLRTAMVNLVLTQIRSEIGKLELDETFTARTEINEILLRELDIATDPWGVKVTRVELRDIMPSKAVQDSMELQMAAERRKRASILTSEGDRDAAINSAQGQAEAQILQAEAAKRAAILQAEAEQRSQVLAAQATAEALLIITERLGSSSHAQEALKYILTQSYLDMGKTIGSSESAKVVFLDPRNILATLEGVRSLITDKPDAPPEKES